MKIHALLVGVDDYHDNRIPNLNGGAKNCLDGMKKYLSSKNASILELRDEHAKREAVISAFKTHFRQASGDDICLFYYIGHGTQIPAPKEMADITGESKNESLICYCNEPLEDKEILYLIQETVKNKQDLQFVMITDCCFSGGLSRNKEMDVVLGVDGGILGSRSITKYEGYTGSVRNYINNSRNNSRLVHLAAAAKGSRAFCTTTPEGYKGIFSYFLLKALNDQGYWKSYAALINSIAPLMHNRAPDATPFIDGGLSGNPVFGAQRSLEINFQDDHWVLNAGFLQGVTPSDPYSKTSIRLEDGSIATIARVFETWSVIEGAGHLDKGKTLKAVIEQLAVPRLNIAFEPGSDAGLKQRISEIAENQPSILWQFSDRPEAADFIIHARENECMVSKTADSTPLFEPVSDSGNWSLIDLINRLEKVAQWENTFRLANLQTAIHTDEFEVQFFRVTDPGNLENDAPAEKLPWWSKNDFAYQPVNGEWQPPAYKLGVSNTGNRPLWVSALYLGFNFHITGLGFGAQGQQSVRLDPGATVWQTDVFQDSAFVTIPLSIPEDYLAAGWHQITEHIKILISTQSLDVRRLEQEGLPLASNPAASRQAGQKPRVDLPEWTTVTLDFGNQHPGFAPGH